MQGLKLQLGHAGEGVEITPICRLCFSAFRFNWATPVKAWRSYVTRSLWIGTQGLQLGHAGEGVEMRKRSTEANRGIGIASIGPRR